MVGAQISFKAPLLEAHEMLASIATSSFVEIEDWAPRSIVTNPVGLQVWWTDQGLHHHAILFGFLPQSA